MFQRNWFPRELPSEIRLENQRRKRINRDGRTVLTLDKLGFVCGICPIPTLLLIRIEEDTRELGARKWLEPSRMYGSKICIPCKVYCLHVDYPEVKQICELLEEYYFVLWITTLALILAFEINCFVSQLIVRLCSWFLIFSDSSQGYQSYRVTEA